MLPHSPRPPPLLLGTPGLPACLTCLPALLLLLLLQEGVDFWIIRNSWSKLWGKDGYAKITRKGRGGGQGEGLAGCGCG